MPEMLCVAQRAFIAEISAAHRHHHAGADVVAERHRAQEMRAVDAEMYRQAQARRERSKDPGCDRDGLWESSVSSACAMTPLASAASTGDAVNVVPAIVAEPCAALARM